MSDIQNGVQGVAWAHFPDYTFGMTETPSAMYLEHPEDVLKCCLSWSELARVALVIVTHTDGGAVRAPGAMMAVREDGASAGYISGGCIDSDVVLQAQSAIQSCETKALRYGKGSPFADLQLPCGGAIDILILPCPDLEFLHTCQTRLAKRQPASLTLSGTHKILSAGYANSSGKTFRYTPRLRLRIAGRGADCLALARIAEASGLSVKLQMTQESDVQIARSAGFKDISRLTSPADLPECHDDARTAFILAFHDPHWETALLDQALNGPAFYIGGVGSPRTHARRSEALLQMGQPAHQITRIHGPIGIVPSLRDASPLALSALAEIISEDRKRLTQPFRHTAIILLAAGQSSRFEDGDKLLADWRGAPLLDRAAGKLANEKCAEKIAVIGPDQVKRAAILTARGWTVITAEQAVLGMAESIKAGLACAASNPQVSAAMFTLGDMPNISDIHLKDLRDSLSPDLEAVMSVSDDVLLPPAIFARSAFGDLASLSGDAGARGVFNALSKTTILPLPTHESVDIDRREDLQKLNEFANA